MKDLKSKYWNLIHDGDNLKVWEHAEGHAVMIHTYVSAGSCWHWEAEVFSIKNDCTVVNNSA